MLFAEIEDRILEFRSSFSRSSMIPDLVDDTEPNRLYVIKYTAAKLLSDILTTQKLFASNTPGYTWGDAVYVAPVTHPRSTMMYGSVGVMGWINTNGLNLFDAINPEGIRLYQLHA